MKLRFKVDQSEALRRGVDCPRSINTIEVDPAELTEEQRRMIADRMDGIDLYNLHAFCDRETYQGGTHITASLPTFDELWKAIQANEDEVRKALAKKSPELAAA